MSDSTVTTTAHLQIERVIRRSSVGAYCEADFVLDGKWMCCHACIIGKTPQISARGILLTPAQAFAVATALQMAIDWIAEELGGI